MLNFFLREHLQKLSISGESEHPFAISFEDVAAAAFRIRKGIVKTPCEVIKIMHWKNPF